MRTIYISRHEMLPAQMQAAEFAGLQIVKQIAAYEGSHQHKQWKDEGIDAVLTVALPPHLLASLSTDFQLYVFKMQSVMLFDNEEEAKRWRDEAPDRRTLLPSTDTYRGLEFISLVRMQVSIVEEQIYP